MSQNAGLKARNRMTPVVFAMSKILPKIRKVQRSLPELSGTMLYEPAKRESSLP